MVDIAVPLGTFSLKAPSYMAVGVNFDNSTYLTRGANFTGVVSGKSASGAFSFKSTEAGYVFRNSGSGSSIFEIFLSAFGILSILGQNSAGQIRLSMSSSASYADGNWHHCAWSFDLNGGDSANGYLYLDGVSDKDQVAAFTDDTLDFGQPNHAVGASTSGSTTFNGDMGDLWLFFNVPIDLGAEITKFYDGGTVPLGTDGSEPTGSSPHLFLSGAVASWHTNDGTGGGLTLNGGTLTAAATNPPGTLLPPMVSTGASAAAPLGSFSLTGFAPGVFIGINIEAPAGAFTLTPLVPAVNIGANVITPLHAFTFTGLAPFVATGGAKVAVPLGTFTLTGNAPEILARGWSIVADTPAAWATVPDAGGVWVEVSQASAVYVEVPVTPATWTKVIEG